MNKIISRLLVFFIGVPAVIAIIFMPFFNHVMLHLLICAVSAVAAGELHDLFSIKSILLPKKYIIGCSIFIPLVAAVQYAAAPAAGMKFYAGQELITFAYIITILVSLALEVFTAKSFEHSIEKISLSVFIITYTGFLLSFVSRMTAWTLDGKSIADQVVCVYILMVFMCDSIAWLFGMLLGKNNRGVVKASPNKSRMGFLGGFVGAAAAGLFGYVMWPGIFSGPVFKIILTGICIALSSIVGDLTESVFKRAANIKDSGKIIPGRGGMLDSIDSIVMSAPVYYLLVSVLFGPFS
ncbi:MAG: phosphatidate cytidylyltransferase [Treponema sp.]|nr:phosphatidate cytidylyltransferase [Treponema sp.]